MRPALAFFAAYRETLHACYHFVDEALRFEHAYEYEGLLYSIVVYNIQ